MDDFGWNNWCHDILYLLLEKAIEVKTMETTHLVPLGWDIYNQKLPYKNTNESLRIGRVSEAFADQYRVMTGEKDIAGILAGRFYYEIESTAELPVVGDWIVYQPVPGENKCVIQEVLPRVNHISRKNAGKKTTEQVMVANIDLLFIVQGLDHDFNPRRLERYLLMAVHNEIRPVIILNKSDLVSDLADTLAAVEQLAAKADIHLISALTGNSVEAVSRYLRPGITAVFVGSSGAGKSTLLNRLLGAEAQKVQSVREDDSRGRHTTTARQLFVLTNGALIIDTPGMRELEPWSADESLGSLFPEIEEYADQCRFADCSHETEPGCAVLQAIEDGLLAKEMLKSYHKLGREQEYQRSRVDEQAHLDYKQKEKKFRKMCKEVMRDKRRKRGE